MNHYRLSVFFQQIAFGISALIPLFWREGLKLSESSIGIISAIGTIVSLCSPIVYGKIASVVSVEKPIAVAFFSYGICAFLYMLSDAFFPSFFSQTIIFCLHEITKWGFFTLVPVGVLQILGSRTGSEYGKYRSFGSIGYLLGAMGAGILSDSFGFKAMFFVMGVASIVAAYPFYKHIKIPARKEQSTKFAELLSRKKLRNFFLAVICLCTYMSFVFVFMPLRIRELGASNSDISIVLSLNGLLAIVGLFVLGPVIDSISSKHLLLAAVASAFLRVGLMFFATSLPGFYMIQILHLGTWVLIDLLYIKCTKELVSPHQYAKFGALTLVSTSLGMAFGSVFGALILKIFEMKYLFLFGSLLPLLAVPFIFKMYENETEEVLKS